MVRVKICGITNQEDARAAVYAGADALGFIFYQQSPRYVPPEQARAITDTLPPFVTTVGVFVNESVDRVRDIAAACRLSVVQLHGDETPEYCRQTAGAVIKAFRVKDASWREMAEGYPVQAVLLDAYSPDKYGGTGEPFDWRLAVGGSHRVILSGGLNPDNVQEAIRQAAPYAVDASSGVEREPGRKDHDRVRAFIKRAKDEG